MVPSRHNVTTEIENTEAFDAFCSAYLDLVYRYIIYQVRERATAEDLTRKTFLKAWKSRGEDKCDGSQFSAWLYRIAQNHIAEYFRANPQCQTVEMEPPAGDNASEREADRDKIERLFVSAISCLPEQQRQVIILKFIEGLDNPQTGQAMASMQGTIRMLQIQALATLRQKLNAESQDRKITAELSEVLDECLTLIRSGEAIEACLSKYFYARRELEPLLYTAISISHAPKASPSEEFRSTFKASLTARPVPKPAPAKAEKSQPRNHEPKGLATASQRLMHALSARKRMAVAITSMLLLVLIGSLSAYVILGSQSSSSVPASSCTLTT